MPSIAYFPVVEDQNSLIDLLSRAAWFLSSCPAERIHVPIASESLGRVDWKVAAGMDPAIADRFEALRRKVDFVVASKESDLESCMSSSDIVLRWKKDAKPGFVSGATLGRWLKGKKVWEVDPKAVRMEGSFYIEVGLHLTPNRAALVRDCKSKFDALARRLGKYERAFLLATGPSVSAYKLHDFKGALSIACNSVILDEQLMQEVAPKILVFADPIFHFGPSQYAAAFRNALLDAARRHDFTICMPFKYYPLFLAAVPELADRTIGIPFTKDREFNFSLDKDFDLKTTANILTFLMVPLAGTFADEIGILGCDGRPLSEDKYFWGHNAKTQINDKMANIRAVHPGFFAIDYNDYYLEHCSMLEQQLQAAERNGKKVHSLAFSHIPALSSRTKRTWRKFSASVDEAPRRAAIIDPDGVDTSGHFLAYNTQLGDALAKMGVAPTVVCGTAMAPDLLQRNPNYMPRLSVKSWTVGASADAASCRKAREELLAAIDELGPEDPLLLYMYAGSLNHAEILAEATRRHPKLYVNINLFWLSFRDFLSSPDYVRRWRRFMQWLDRAGPRFVATVPTVEVRDDIAREFGVVLEVAPHPSTAVPDDLLLKRAGRPTDPSAPVKVLFPGSLRTEKGYSLGIECARALGGDPSIRSLVRHTTTASTPETLQQEPDDLPANTSLVTGKLDNEAFMRLFVESDMVVLPYSPEAFSKRTSGLLIDALACGRPAVVVEGTWLAGHVRRHGCGVVVPDATVESLCNGIREVVGSLDAMRARTLHAGEEYFRDNSWRKLAESLFAPFRATQPAPRLLAIDLTRIGGISATSRVKEAFFRGWPDEAIGSVSFDSNAKALRSDGLGHDGPGATKELVDAAVKFAPDVVYYRAVEDDLVHDFAVEAIAALGRPYVVHLMDDWPTRLQKNNPAAFARIDASLRKLLSGAAAALSIGEAMSQEFSRRYGVQFTPFANAIDPAAFPPRSARREGDFVITYAGALADDMVLDSVTNTAFAVDTLPAELNVKFNIHTRPPWQAIARKAYGSIAAVDVLDPVPSEDYYAILQEADAVLIAYNFDQKSRDYIGYSIANKMPECLASGTPILAIGPADVATIAYLQKTRAAFVVDSADQPSIAHAIKRLVAARGEETEVQKMARDVAFARHNVWDVASRFRTLMADVALGRRQNMSESAAILGPYDRARHARWDETQAVARLYGAGMKGSVMIDVGAHHGSALMPFLNMGWKVLAFEPDEKNRAQLLDRLAKHPGKDRVALDTRAVSDHSEKGLSFYRSEVSTGISGLSAFHESHREAQRVDIVSLSEVLAGSQISHVDFLKIDTEGHDLFVLKGFPWDRFKPAVVECEFEDSKTVPLGYKFDDLAGYLVARGYSVYVSEWHPVVRYGIQHDWHRLMKYPCRLANTASWGNILAFREPVDPGTLADAVQAVMKFGTPNAGAQAGGPIPLPAPAVPISGGGECPYEVIPGAHFTEAGGNRWQYVADGEGHRIWIAAFDLSAPTSGVAYIGGIRLQADKSMDVSVSLARHGATEYEGTKTRVRLSPGVPQHVEIGKLFAGTHPALKIQVDIDSDVEGGRAELSIDSLCLLESPQSIGNRLQAGQISLAMANRVFRNKDYSTALGLYLMLYRQNPLSMYRENALMTARRLRLRSKATIEELLELGA